MKLSKCSFKNIYRGRRQLIRKRFRQYVIRKKHPSYLLCIYKGNVQTGSLKQFHYTNAIRLSLHEALHHISVIQYINRNDAVH